MTTPYIDPNLIFAENAPVQDKPAAFSNYDKGWDESRKNDGRPLIPQMNYLAQQADLKNLYIHENGAALPYKDGITYEENAVVVKDGVLQQWEGGDWVIVSEQEVKRYLLDAGITEAELDSEYNYLMQRLAQIAVDKGWDASFVVDGGENQHQINNTTVRVVESLSDMLDINSPKNGQTVFAKCLQGGLFIYDDAKASINDGIVTFNGWGRQIKGFITPFMSGARLDGSDSSVALQIAFNYSQNNNVKLTGLGKTFHCNDVIFDSNLQFYDAYLVCNKFDTDMISVIKTRGTIDPENTTKDFYFYNIHIDGKRALHTNIVGALGEDGGRHGFRIRNIIENGVWEKCSANYCAVDGFEFFVGGYDSTRNDLIRNCKLIDCEAQWNGRHGASSDAENGLEIIRGKYKNNGKDLIHAPYSSGNSARRLTGEGTALYGVGWDFETYHPDTHPKNIRIVDVDMRDNARQSITFYRPNNPNQPSSENNITIDGGLYNSGLIDGDAITFATFETSNVGLMYDGVVLNNVDLGGQNLTLIGCNANLSNIKNYRRIDVQASTIYTDKEYNHTVYDSSPFYVNLHSNQPSNSLGKVKQNYNLDLPIGSLVGDITSINIKHESKRGGISFKMEPSGSLTTYFYARDVAIFAVGHDGACLC